MNKTMKLLAAFAILSFAALLVFAWFYESAVPHINLLISTVGFIILPLLIWQFGSVKADEKREMTTRETTLNLVLLDVEYLSKNAMELVDQLERVLEDFDKFNDSYPGIPSSEDADLNEFHLILASTRTLPKFKYEFGFTKKDLQIFSKDDFKMFDRIFQLCNAVNELNENLASLNQNFKNALDEVDKRTPQDDGLYARYAFVNNSYRGVFEDILSDTCKLFPKINDEVLPSILNYVKTHFAPQLFKYYENVAARIKK